MKTTYAFIAAVSMYFMISIPWAIIILTTFPYSPGTRSVLAIFGGFAIMIMSRALYDWLTRNTG